MITRAFCEAISSRIFKAIAPGWSDQPYLGLGRARIEDLLPSSTLSDVLELPSTNGYQRAQSSVAGWQTRMLDDGADLASLPEAYLTFPSNTFTNTGAVSWPAAQIIFLVSEVSGTPKLFGAWSIPKIEVAPGDSLQLSHIRIPWRFRVGVA